MKGAYLLLLLVSLGGLVAIDHHFHLAYFKDSKRTLTILAFGAAFFIAWDIAGILLKIFFIGSTQYLIGLRIGEFPVEEIFFLILLNYNTLIVYTYLKKRLGS